MPDTVTVASRLPMSIRMDMDGQDGANINGSNHREALDGAGITRDVPKALFDAWVEAHGKSDAVRQGLIMQVDDAPAEADPVPVEPPAAPPA